MAENIFKRVRKAGRKLRLATRAADIERHVIASETTPEQRALLGKTYRTGPSVTEVPVTPGTVIVGSTRIPGRTTLTHLPGARRFAADLYKEGVAGTIRHEIGHHLIVGRMPKTSLPTQERILESFRQHQTPLSRLPEATHEVRQAYMAEATRSLWRLRKLMAGPQRMRRSR